MALTVDGWRWQRRPRDVGYLMAYVVFFQFFFGFMIFVPLCCAEAWAAFMAIQYGVVDLFLLLRLLVIPRLRHQSIPELSGFQRIIISASPFLMAVASMYIFDWRLP